MTSDRRQSDEPLPPWRPQMIKSNSDNLTRLHRRLLSPTALGPNDFAQNPALVEEICRTLRTLRDANDDTQIVLFLMRITGAPLDKIIAITDLSPIAVEQRLQKLCDMVAFLDAAPASSRNMPS
jgi:hypothetical protein